MPSLNINDYLEFIRLGEEVERHGFSITRSRYGIDELALIPADDHWPYFDRDHNFTTGSSDQLRAFLHGLEFAKRYYQMLGLVSDTKIARKEQDERNRQLVKQMKEEVK